MAKLTKWLSTGCRIRVQRIIAEWEAYQVELSGRYSLSRLTTFRIYERNTSMWRVALICIVTPLPSLALATIVECIPLRHPSAGINANYVFWIRDWMAVFFISIGFLEQFRNCLPRLPLSNLAMGTVSVFASNVGVGFQYLCANLIGFPLPFAPIFGASLWAVALLLGCWILWGKRVKKSATLGTELTEYLVVFACQCALTIVYPAYIFVFNSLHGVTQNAFVVVLTLLKMGMRKWIRQFIRLDDLVSEVVIFNIDVFHALYVSCSLQAGTTATTTVVVMAIDLIQAAITVSDIRNVYTPLSVLLRKANTAANKPQRNFLDLCSELVQDMRVTSHPTFQTAMIPRRFTFRTVRPYAEVRTSSPTVLQVHPSPLVDRSLHIDNQLTLAERVEVVRLASKLLFLTEFVALVEFTEVVMPLVYAVYSVAMSNLPNRLFYPRLAELPPDQLYDTARGVVAYAAIEMVMFVVFTVLLGRWLKISLLHQVAFVLETHASEVQSKLMVWLFFVLQSMLMHFGVDFSMKFEWLKYNWREMT